MFYAVEVTTARSFRKAVYAVDAVVEEVIPLWGVPNTDDCVAIFNSINGVEAWHPEGEVRVFQISQGESDAILTLQNIRTPLQLVSFVPTIVRGEIIPASWPNSWRDSIEAEAEEDERKEREALEKNLIKFLRKNCKLVVGDNTYYIGHPKGLDRSHLTVKKDPEAKLARVQPLHTLANRIEELAGNGTKVSLEDLSGNTLVLH